MALTEYVMIYVIIVDDNIETLLLMIQFLMESRMQMDVGSLKTAKTFVVMLPAPVAYFAHIFIIMIVLNVVFLLMTFAYNNDCFIIF